MTEAELNKVVTLANASITLTLKEDLLIRKAFLHRHFKCIETEIHLKEALRKYEFLLKHSSGGDK